MNRESPRLSSYALLAGAQLAVAAAAIFARYALEGAQPIAVSALRLVAASILLFLLAGLRKQRLPAPKPAAIRVLVFAGLMLALHFASWIWSLQYTTVAVSTLLVTTTPLWTALYDALVLKRRFSWMVWAAYATGAAGLILVAGAHGSPPPVPGHQFLGAALALCGSIAIGAYFTAVRTVRNSLSTQQIVSWTYPSAAVVLAVAAALAQQPPPPFGNATAWFGILAMALVSQLLGHTALNAALRWFSPNAVAMATLLEPVLAALLAAALLHERISLAALAGGAVLLVSIGVVLREEVRVN